MTDSKSDRLGLRGRLAHFESALRLLGGANATGVIAAGAAFHAFAQNAEVQGSVKLAAVLFLFGIFTFVIAYMGWFLTVLDVDHALQKDGDPIWPDYLFMIQSKTAEQYQASAKRAFLVTCVSGTRVIRFLLCGLRDRTHDGDTFAARVDLSLATRMPPASIS